MTPEQKERIRAAARELSAALTAAGDDFDVRVGGLEMTFIDDERPRYSYAINVILRTEEVIA